MFITLDNNQKFYELFERSVQNGLLYHIFFWVVFFFFLVIVGHTEGASLGMEMANKSIRIIFYVIIVYTNLNYLFPKFLKTNKLFTYLAFLVLLVVIATPIEVLLHYLFLESSNSFDEVFTLESNSKVFLGSFFVGFSSSIYKIISDWMEHQRERIDLQRQNLTSELKYLKTQINPHFFFNTLNSLYALTLKKSDKAPEIVLKLSEMMRYMLYESNERLIELNQEINYIKNYLELEKLRHGEHIKVDLQINGDPTGLKIAPLLFIPFLENCFKHGIDHEINSGYVSILINIKDVELDLKVRNSYPSERKDQLSNNKVGGIGLTNVRRRLNILYPKRHKLEINKTDSEFIVTVNLQLTKQFHQTTSL